MCGLEKSFKKSLLNLSTCTWGHCYPIAPRISLHGALKKKKKSLLQQNRSCFRAMSLPVKMAKEQLDLQEQQPLILPKCVQEETAAIPRADP